MKRCMWIIGTAVLAALVGCNANQAHKDNEHEGDEVAINQDQLPPAVRDTMNRESGGAGLTKIEKETKDGKTSYEANATINAFESLSVQDQQNLLNFLRSL